MAVTKLTYATNAAITITTDSLASSQTVGRSSAYVDNTTNDYLDALVVGIVPLASGTTANDQAIYVYAYGTVDTTHYTEGVTGTDASFTINNPTSLRLIGVIPTPSGGITYTSGPWSVANAFGGIVPERWGLVVVNYSGLALGTGTSWSYQGITATTA